MPYQVVREPRPSDRSPSWPMGLRISPPSRLISCLGPQSLACIDGGSVGGMEALRTGQFRLNKSGCNLNVIRSLTKMSRAGS